jgi:TatD family-associated radical SAM protein
MQIAYELEGALYLNITNACPNRCVFCVRDYARGVGGYDLWLERAPTVEEVLAAVGDAGRYREIVFCGYGEPTCRLEVLLEAARALQGKGVPLRLNTNGLGNLINGRDILPELAGLFDVVSVSLNAADADAYGRLCRSSFGAAAYPAVISFIRDSVGRIPRVAASVVSGEGVDVEACKKIAAELGAEFRIRGIIPNAKGQL